LSLIGCSYLSGTRDVLNTIPLVDEKSLKTIEEPGEILQPDQPDGNVPVHRKKIQSIKKTKTGSNNSMILYIGYSTYTVLRKKPPKRRKGITRGGARARPISAFGVMHDMK
jgi:hypothetical protein